MVHHQGGGRPHGRILQVLRFPLSHRTFLPGTTRTMITTSFAYGDSYGIGDRYGYDEREHDDLMTADDYDARRMERDGWQTGHWNGRW